LAAVEGIHHTEVVAARNWLEVLVQEWPKDHQEVSHKGPWKKPWKEGQGQAEWGLFQRKNHRPNSSSIRLEMAVRMASLQWYCSWELWWPSYLANSESLDQEIGCIHRTVVVVDIVAAAAGEEGIHTADPVAVEEEERNLGC
jgi:hypothetical protein